MTVVTIIPAGWCKYQKNGKTSALPQGMQKPSVPHVYRLWILFDMWQILLEWAAPVTRALVSAAGT